MITVYEKGSHLNHFGSFFSLNSIYLALESVSNVAISEWLNLVPEMKEMVLK